VAFTDARRFARIRLREDPLTSPPIGDLGFDPLLDRLPLEEFHKRLKKRKAPIKALLLNQSFAAGVGNWIADEVLYQAAVHPMVPAADLSPAQVMATQENLIVGLL
jgi:formamidopyrimidine-DNA glycosylase